VPIHAPGRVNAWGRTRSRDVEGRGFGDSLFHVEVGGLEAIEAGSRNEEGSQANGNHHLE
jgi:hypothetical protein